MGPNAIWVSSLVCITSFILIGVSFSFLLLLPDKFIGLTVTKPFTDWNTISSIIKDVNGYNLTNNTMEMVDVSFSNENRTGQAVLLQRLLDVASCTAPTIVPWVVPGNRTPACGCITRTYLDFINATWTNSLNISMSIREKYADQMIDCLRFQPIWVVESCGDKCLIHPIWVAFYSNCVLFLLTMGYVINYQHHIFGVFWVRMFTVV